MIRLYEMIKDSAGDDIAGRKFELESWEATTEFLKTYSPPEGAFSLNLLDEDFPACVNSIMDRNEGDDEIYYSDMQNNTEDCILFGWMN